MFDTTFSTVGYFIAASVDVWTARQNNLLLKGADNKSQSRFEFDGIDVIFLFSKQLFYVAKCRNKLVRLLSLIKAVKLNHFKSLSDTDYDFFII